MSRSKSADLLISIIPAVWILTAALGTTALIVANVYFAVVVGPSYFPGDAPIADLVLEGGVAIFVYSTIGLVVAFFAARGAKTRFLRFVSKVGLGLLILDVVGSVPVAAEVGKRQFGEWSELKRILRQSEARALQLAGREGGRLTEPEYEKARSWFQENPVSFKFQGMPHPVSVRMMSSLAPYVGVDFGDGKNAVFDPGTMICTYAD